MNANEPLRKRRKETKEDIKSKVYEHSVISFVGNRVLTKRCPALRWHEFTAGFNMERENLCLQYKEKNLNLTKVRMKVLRCSRGTDWLVVARKYAKVYGAKEPSFPVISCNQPQGRSYNQ